MLDITDLNHNNHLKKKNKVYRKRKERRQPNDGHREFEKAMPCEGHGLLDIESLCAGTLG